MENHANMPKHFIGPSDSAKINIHSTNHLCLNVRPVNKEDLTAETIAYQVLHSAAIRFIDDGATSTSSVSAYFRSMLSSQNVLENQRIQTRPFRCVSWMPEFGLSLVEYARVAHLWNALAKLFDVENDSFKGKSLYVLYLRRVPSWEQAIHQYIIHKEMYNDSTINVSAHSHIAFRRISDYLQADAKLQILLEELTTSLEQLTDTTRFQKVSFVVFQCTEFPVVLIELSLQYCFCTQLR